jgi:hypothetical protein
MNLAHEKIRKANPGMHVLISLDVNNKSLKTLVRETPGRDSKPSWAPLGNPIALPPDALNPKLKDLPEDFCLPTTPTLVVSTPGKTQPQSGNTQIRLKVPEYLRQQLAEENKGKTQGSSSSEEGENEVFSDPGNLGSPGKDSAAMEVTPTPPSSTVSNVSPAAGYVPAE